MKFPWQPRISEGDRVRGSCTHCKTYELRAHITGVVYCGNCGAEDLIPTGKGKLAGSDGVAAYDAFVDQYHREVRRGYWS